MELTKKQLTNKINDFSASSKNRNIRRLYTDIKGLDVGFPPRSKIVKNGNGDIV
jgi:hypothetical protein